MQEFCSYQAEETTVPYAKHYQHHQNDTTVSPAGVGEDLKHGLFGCSDRFEVIDRKQQRNEQEKSEDC